MNGVLVPSQFGMIFLPMTVVQVKSGDMLRVTCQFSHIGEAESVSLYAALGNSGAFGFNEVLHGSGTISVPEDASWQYHEGYVDISITSAISPGFYDLYAKINGGIPRVISPTLNDVVEVIPDIAESEFGEISITDYSKV
ncbi:MAG: hypothetical protein H8D49_03825 [Dehalococcoidia bacterium]|nr:hypothetical protein [Dehalococcoidia bacterium]